MREGRSPRKAFVLGTIAVNKRLDLVSLSLAVALLLSQFVLPEWLLGPIQISMLV
jgi:hypothetical protein